MNQAAILTISDSRSLADDRSGDLISDLLTKNHITIIDRRIVKDDIVDIQTAFLELEQARPDIIITTGGNRSCAKRCHHLRRPSPSPANHTRLRRDVSSNIIS